MTTLPTCPKCNSEYTYEDRGSLNCPECAHEWSANETEEQSNGIKDANGKYFRMATP